VTTARLDLASNLEERFLIALGKIRPSEHDIRTASECIAKPAFSWARTFDYATVRWVQSILVHNLRDTPELIRQVPDELEPRLAELEAAAFDRWEIFRRAVEPVLADIAKDGIKVVLLKGAALATTIYPPRARKLNDLDILVEKKHYHRVAAALKEHGFDLALREGQTEAFRLDTYHEMGFAKTTDEAYLALDLHWFMITPKRAYFIDTPELLSRVVDVEFGSVPALATSPEDTLLHYATQLVEDRYKMGFLRGADIYGLVRSQIDWQLLVETAERISASGPARLALGVAERLGAEVPEDVIDALERPSRGAGQATWFLVEPAWLFKRRVASQPSVPVLRGLLESRHQPTDTIRRSSLRYWYWWAQQRRSHFLGRILYTTHGFGKSTTWALGLRLQAFLDALKLHGLAARVRDALWAKPPV